MRHSALVLGLVVAGSLVGRDTVSPAVLVTNEFAHLHATHPQAVLDPTWDVTSGSLFERNGSFWTGPPDGLRPDPRSLLGTDSAVFRATTRRRDYGDVRVMFDLRVAALVTTDRTPPRPWDGVHVFLRYQSEFELYAVSVNRRDGTVAIKKKVPAASGDTGSYHTLATAETAVAVGHWQAVTADIRTIPAGVLIRLWRGSVLIVRALDDGTIGGPAIRAPGGVGLRGDNCEFEFRSFTVLEREG